MASRILALLIWAAVAASLAFWGLRWLAQPTAVPSNASAVSLDNAGKGDPHRLLMGPSKASGPAGPDMSANAMLAGRIKLIGVVAPQQAGDTGGVALISVDNKPPRAIRLGGVVDGSHVLRALTQRGAEIGPQDGPTALRLDLPALPPPAIGVVAAATGLVVNHPTPSGYTPPPPIPPSAQAPNGMPPPQGGERRPGSN